MSAPSYIVVLNCGSSSIKFGVFEAGASGDTGRTPAWNGKVQGIGGPQPDFGAADRKSNHRRTIMAQVLGITGLQAEPA